MFRLFIVSLSCLALIVLNGCDTSTNDSTNNAPSITAFSVTPTGGVAPLVITYNATATDADAKDTLTHTWSLGDNSSSSPFQGTTSNGTHTYNQEGTYMVTLNVSDGTDSVKREQEIIVSNAPPTIDGFSVDVRAGTMIIDYGASASDPNGGSISYAWNFGDNSTVSTIASGNHTYSAAGTYTVTLTVSDGKASTSRTQEITIGSN